jgi:hypothetical protein
MPLSCFFGASGGAPIGTIAGLRSMGTTGYKQGACVPWPNKPHRNVLMTKNLDDE